MRRAFVLTMALAVLALGCSYWVDPRDDHPYCEKRDGGPEVCPMGSLCIAGRCQVNCAKVEICGDNVDNDCDDKIDEVTEDTCGDKIDNDCDGKTDEGSDPDEDGYTWCGNTASRERGRDVDCDPDDKAIHPGAKEVCDGRDNNCDGHVDETDEGPLCGANEQCSGQCVEANCPSDPRGHCLAGERCDEGLKRCVTTVDNECGNETCGSGQRCDVATMRCTTTLLAEGTECQVNEECASTVCAPAAAYRFAATRPGANVCVRACCSDMDCTEGQRCFASGTGARSCLPASLVPPQSPPQCTNDQACAQPTICALNRAQSLSAPTFLPHSELITSTCRTPLPNSLPLGQRCARFDECASRICGIIRQGSSAGLCTVPCASADECRPFEQAARAAGITARIFCRYVALDLKLIDRGGVCSIDRGGWTGTRGPNQPCNDGRDCIEGTCVNATPTQKGRCAPGCCTDDQCGRGEDGRQIHCRPFGFGATYEMRCDLGVDP